MAKNPSHTPRGEKPLAGTAAAASETAPPWEGPFWSERRWGCPSTPAHMSLFGEPSSALGQPLHRSEQVATHQADKDSANSMHYWDPPCTHRDPQPDRGSLCVPGLPASAPRSSSGGLQAASASAPCRTNSSNLQTILVSLSHGTKLDQGMTAGHFWSRSHALLEQRYVCSLSRNRTACRLGIRRQPLPRLVPSGTTH